MSVEVVKNPVNNKEITLVKGKVEGIWFNALKEVRTYSGQRGTNWTPTHSVNITVDQTRVNLGLSELRDGKEIVRCKDSDGNYHDLTRGSEVSIVITEVSEYNGKPQYSARTSGVTILEVVKEAPSQSNSGSTAGFSRDFTGVEVGHAINCALNVLDHEYDSPKTLCDLSKELHSLTVELKKEYKEKNSSLSDYDIGASVGHAVLNACQVTTDLAEIKEVALEILNDVVPEVTTFIKESKNTDKKESVEDEKPAPKKRRSRKKVEEEAPKVEETSVEDIDEFEDDDLPF